MLEVEEVEVASPEHGWQLDSPTRACLRTSVVAADGSPILHQDRYNDKSFIESSLSSDVIQTFRQMSR